ncbi:serine protease snake-like [Copidosoma floridanum]|uniref:serine protease snake-like n=1 Tax=Copidosoma floridanum TaxID=29053 RepID=UPI000C6F4730|nr:serine protease snake-like [Copidosoma floridanum]
MLHYTMAITIDWRVKRFKIVIIIYLMLIFFKAVNTLAYSQNTDLYEGSSCDLNDNNKNGKCVMLPQCPLMLQQILRKERRTSNDKRCGFKGSIEIVCCSVAEIERYGRFNYSRLYQIEQTTVFSTTSMLLSSIKKNSKTTSSLTHPGVLNFLRPAEIACTRYETASTGEDAGRVTTYITNGERAAFAEFPYMVALGYPRDDGLPQLRYICGGTLIHEKYVLTAAHCVSNLDNVVPVQVKLGTTNLNTSTDDEQNIKVKKIIYHPQYKRSFNYHDIAIIELQREVTITKTVMPLCLQLKPLSNLDTLANQDVLVMGWGATSLEGDGNNELQKTSSLA